MEVYEYVGDFPEVMGGRLFVLFGFTKDDRAIVFPLVADQTETIEIDGMDWENDFAFLVTVPE